MGAYCPLFIIINLMHIHPLYYHLMHTNSSFNDNTYQQIVEYFKLYPEEINRGVRVTTTKNESRHLDIIPTKRLGMLND